MTAAEKACTKCAETKPLDQFRRDSRCLDGRTSACKACERPAARRTSAARNRRWRAGMRLPEGERSTRRERLVDERRADRMAEGHWEWQAHAACRGKPTAWWFPSDNQPGPGLTAEEQTARRICRTECTVRAECLEFAIATRQDDGVWGGTTQSQRKVIRRERRLAEIRQMAEAQR